MTLILIVSLLSALVIVVHGTFCVINGMSRCTSVGIRLSWIAITTGAFGFLVTPLYHFRPPTIWEAFLLLGIATWVLFDRRCRRRRHGDVPR